jgi:hypothetical protein
LLAAGKHIAVDFLARKMHKHKLRRSLLAGTTRRVELQQKAMADPADVAALFDKLSGLTSKQDHKKSLKVVDQSPC